MSRITLLLSTIVLVCVVNVNAQNDQKSATTQTASAFKLDSFDHVTHSIFRSSMDSLLEHLAKNPDGRQGLIVNYGPYRAVQTRKRLMNWHINFRGFDRSTIRIITGGNIGPLKTDIWIILSGAELPALDPEAYIVDEFRRFSAPIVAKRMARLFSELRSKPDAQGYIINYGTDAQIATREKSILRGIGRAEWHDLRLTFVRGTPGESRTVMWVVPHRAQPPVP